MQPAIFSAAEPGNGDSSTGSSSAAGNPTQQQQGPGSSSPSSWGLAGLRDMIWSNGDATDDVGITKDSNKSNDIAPFAMPFGSMFSSSTKQQQEQHDMQADHADSSAAAATTDDATQTDSEATEDDSDQAAGEAAAATAGYESDNADKVDSDDTDSDWEPEDDDSGDLIDSLQGMLARCWFGTDSSISSKQQQHEPGGEIKSYSLPSHSPFQFSSTRTRQLAQRRSQQQQLRKRASSAAVRSASKPPSVKGSTGSNNKSNSKSNTTGDEDDDSWIPSSWLPRPMQRALGRTESSRASGWHAKPLRVKMAEQVLGEGLVDAMELVQRDILESEDPLPEATIKFFVRAGVGVATGWAHKHLNRIFFALGGFVAATCGAMHGTKKAAKWAAWRLPFGAGRKAGPAVAFAADVLLPTQFFGPFAASYVVVRIVVKEQRRMLAAAAAVQAAEELGADGKTVARAAVSAALDPAAAGDDEHILKSATAIATEEQLQQQENKQSQQQLSRVESSQRSGSIAAGGSCRNKVRERTRSGEPAAAAAAGAESEQQQEQERAQRAPSKVPVIGMLTASSEGV